MSGQGANSVMIQGTGSNVGKSLLVAGLCRAFLRRGLRVAPFKPQNMSNNAYVTLDGREIGRAQALQALACGLEAHSDMNPVLLKPETDTGAQVLLHGEVIARAEAADYAALRARLLGGVLASFDRLRRQYDLVIVEGAGSPAEVNLRSRDIANMGFAQDASVPVVLAGDIDRGGVIAQIVGTHAVIDPRDAALVRGFLINKFRGDPRLFDDGYELIESLTGWRGFGVLPWYPYAHHLPAEDAVDTRQSHGTGAHVVCLMLSRMANFDDLDPLLREPGLKVTMLPPGVPIPADSSLVIVPGTKSTIGDLDFLRRQGWDIDLKAHHRRGGQILGICGGFQMLGQTIMDSGGSDGAAGTAEGLGLLNVTTQMVRHKQVTRRKGLAMGCPVEGYEIHVGRSQGADCSRPFAHLPEPDGAISADGRIMGTYLHGLFAMDAFRAAFLARLGVSSLPGFGSQVETALEGLAEHIETHLDVTGILNVAKSGL